MIGTCSGAGAARSITGIMHTTTGCSIARGGGRDERKGRSMGAILGEFDEACTAIEERHNQSLQADPGAWDKRECQSTSGASTCEAGHSNPQGG